MSRNVRVLLANGIGGYDVICCCLLFVCVHSEQEDQVPCRERGDGPEIRQDVSSNKQTQTTVRMCVPVNVCVRVIRVYTTAGIRVWFACVRCTAGCPS